jgi:hypothetical protein
MVLLATSECSRGQTHAFDEMPLVLAGGANGRLATGLHHRSFTGENVSHLMLTLLRAVGINAASYGVDAGEVFDGLSAIEL